MISRRGRGPRRVPGLSRRSRRPAAKVPAILAAGNGLGFLVIIGAAVVGQIGRGLQGRVI